MARSLADVEAQIKTLLGDPVKKAAAFEERDWAGVIAILKPEGGPWGVVSRIAALIGVKRDTLSKRISRGDTSVHGRGPAPVIPTPVAKALSDVFLQHQLVKRTYPYALALTGALDVAGKLNLRPTKDITPRMMKHALRKVGTGRRQGELTGAHRTLSVAKESIKAWTTGLEMSGIRDMPPCSILAGDETDVGERGQKKTAVSPTPPPHPFRSSNSTLSA